MSKPSRADLLQSRCILIELMEIEERRLRGLDNQHARLMEERELLEERIAELTQQLEQAA